MPAPTPDEIFEELRRSFHEPNRTRRRRFLPGLLVSFIDLLRHVGATGGTFPTLADFYAAHPRRERTASGGSANTLIIEAVAGRTQSIRPFYESFVRWLRIDNMRLDYPKAAPHATQAWSGYTHWLEGLLLLSEEQLAALEQRVRDFVLAELPEHTIELATRPEPLRFGLFLERFDFSPQRGETTGAAYQGAVFGYIRADAAHLQVETASARTGGRRERRVGDIDALNGGRLVISAEVKQSIVSAADAPDYEELATQVANAGALGLVVALDFEAGVREALREMGLHPVSKADLIDRVKLWDALKQRVAVDALIYYVSRIEHNTPLRERVNAFFDAIEAEAMRTAAHGEALYLPVDRHTK